MDPLKRSDTNHRGPLPLLVPPSPCAEAEANANNNAVHKLAPMTIRRIPALARRHGRAWPIALIVGFLPVLALLLLGYGHAAAQDTVWVRQFGTAGPDRANRVAVDPQGNVYVVGQTSGTLPGQSWAGGLSDAYLKKYDGAANEVWLRQFGGTGDDDATAVAVDPLGYVYVAGRTGGEPAGAMMLGGVSGAFLQKYDPEGAEVWGRQFGFENFAGASAVCVDSEAGLYAFFESKAAWYDKPPPSFVNAIALVRRHLWLTSEGFSRSGVEPDTQKVQPLCTIHS